MNSPVPKKTGLTLRGARPGDSLSGDDGATGRPADSRSRAPCRPAMCRGRSRGRAVTERVFHFIRLVFEFSFGVIFHTILLLDVG